MSREKPPAGVATKKPRVLHQDRHLIAIHKPAGWVVYPEPGDPAPSARTWAEKRLNRPIHPVHRLDKDTSGILLFALDPPTAADLIRDFSRQKIRKTYLAWVEGDHPDEATYRTPLAKKGGKPEPALTLCQKVQVPGAAAAPEAPLEDMRTSRPRTLLEVHPKTGRFHQIRRHLAQAGFPIVGDRIYGPQRGQTRTRDSSAQLCLCAVELELTHPRTKNRMRFRTEPEFLRRVLVSCRP